MTQPSLGIEYDTTPPEVPAPRIEGGCEATSAAPARGEALPRVLFVDDERHVLEGIALTLRRDVVFRGATSGAEALRMLEAEEPFAVIVSDMRMPGMDGVAVLSAARAAAPDTVRVLLTGHADLESAAAAVNEGSIFRFLTKPCPPTVLRQAVAAGVDQHRLLTAERVLLEETLRGSVQMLVDVLALANPAAYGRASRIGRYAGVLARGIGIQGAWRIEIAALLSQIGALSLPVDLVDKLAAARTLTAEERQHVDGLPLLAADILRRVPRLEPVRALLEELHRFLGNRPATRTQQVLSPEARVLAVAHEVELLESQGIPLRDALAQLRGDASQFDSRLVHELGQALGVSNEDERIVAIRLRNVRRGMVFVDDVHLPTGALFFPRGYQVTESTEGIILNMGARPLELEVRVRLGT